MTEITLRGETIHTYAALPETGTAAPDFIAVAPDLSTINLNGFAGKRVVLNIFPSVDTGVCAASVRKFNEAASALDNTVVLCLSADLPFALGRFCGAEGIENAVTASTFRSDFGKTYGVEMQDGALAGLLSRAVVVLDAAHNVIYTEQVPEIGQEPNYDAALAALN